MFVYLVEKPLMKSINPQIKRIYADPSEGDGTRILVDRLWPRGVSKSRAHLDYWYKEVAPGSALREWFDHREDRFQEFRKLYIAELKKNKSEELKNLVAMIASGPVVLLYAAKDEKINHAVVLMQFLKTLVKKQAK